jgi:hypothetical protein
MNIEENNRVRISEEDVGDGSDTDNSWSGMKP